MVPGGVQDWPEGRAPPLFHFPNGPGGSPVNAGKGNLLQPFTGVVQRQEECVHSSHAGETRHTSGEYLQSNSCVFFQPVYHCID